MTEQDKVANVVPPPHRPISANFIDALTDSPVVEDRKTALIKAAAEIERARGDAA